MNESGNKIIGKNRKAFHNYEIVDRIEAGIVLVGTEVKALREGSVNLKDSYAEMRAGEIFLIKAHIGKYSAGNIFNHQPERTRKLLLHQREIKKLIVKVNEKGFTLIPLSMYFRRGYAKVELGLARGKRQYDKRKTIEERERKRELDREVRDRIKWGK